MNKSNVHICTTFCYSDESSSINCHQTFGRYDNLIKSATVIQKYESLIDYGYNSTTSIPFKKVIVQAEQEVISYHLNLNAFDFPKVTLDRNSIWVIVKSLMRHV